MGIELWSFPIVVALVDIWTTVKIISSLVVKMIKRRVKFWIFRVITFIIKGISSCFPLSIWSRRVIILSSFDRVWQNRISLWYFGKFLLGLGYIVTILILKLTKTYRMVFQSQFLISLFDLFFWSSFRNTQNVVVVHKKDKLEYW